MVFLGKVLIWIFILYVSFILLVFIKRWIYDGFCIKAAFKGVLDEYCS